MTNSKVQVCVDFLGDDFLVLSGVHGANADKRRNRRVSIVQEVECSGASGKVSKRLADISAGGMFIDRLTGFAPDSLLTIRFDLADTYGPVKVKAKVVYVEDKVGTGVQFVEIKPRDRMRIDMVVGRLASMKRHVTGKGGGISRVLVKVPVTLLGTEADGETFEEKTEIMTLAKNGGSVQTTRYVDPKAPVFLETPRGVVVEGRIAWHEEGEVWIECRSLARQLGFFFP